MTAGIINQLEQTTEILDGASRHLRSYGLLDLFGTTFQGYGDEESDSDVLALGMSLEDMQELHRSRYDADVDNLVNAICIGNGRPDPVRVRNCVDRYAATCTADEFMDSLMREVLSRVSKSLPQCDIDLLEGAIGDVRNRLGYRKEAIANELASLVYWEVRV